MVKEKLLPLVALATHTLRRHVSLLYVWTACTLLVVMMASSLVVKLFETADRQGREALDKGQRVIFHLASGDIDGTPRHTKHEVTKETIVGNNAGGVSPGETFAGKEGLAPAPLDTLTEQTEKGLIPASGRDGTKPWKYYARPFDSKDARPMVAILMTNLGLSRPQTEDTLALPHNFTLSFSPYASDASAWARRARSDGFESLIDLPMEPVNYPISDPGPYGLLNALDANESRARMHWTLSRYPGYVGLLAPASEKMTPNLSAMRSLLTELTSRGVLFIYYKTPQNAELANLAKSQSMATLTADLVIDDDANPAAIAKQLEALTELARKQGYAIGIAHSYPTTLRALTIWSEDLPAKGVDIAPVSAIAKKLFP